MDVMEGDGAEVINIIGCCCWMTKNDSKIIMTARRTCADFNKVPADLTSKEIHFCFDGNMITHLLKQSSQSTDIDSYRFLSS